MAGLQGVQEVDRRDESWQAPRVRSKLPAAQLSAHRGRRVQLETSVTQQLAGAGGRGGRFLSRHTQPEPGMPTTTAVINSPCKILSECFTVDPE